MFTKARAVRARSTKRNFILAEALEGRILMANRIWDGGAGAGDPNWSQAVNWQQNVPPAAGDALFFPAGVTQRNAVNDLPADTSIIAINFDGTNGYAVSGNRIALGAGGITALSSGSHTFSVPIALNNLGSSVTVSDLATLSMSGPITGNGPLNKGGNGRLELTADSPDFAGAFNINAGSLRINSPSALGNTTGQTFLVDFASLVVGIGASNAAETITLAGSGASSQGALHAEGTATWAGNVDLIGTTTIAVDTGDFTISGNLIGGGDSLVKAGPGRLIFSGAASQNNDVTINAGALRLAGPNPDFGDVVVTSGTTLEITGGRTASLDSLSLIGVGNATTGALLNVSGNNTINGPITLAGNTTIGSTAGTLTLTGSINTGNASPPRVLTTAGAGNVTIGGSSGAITGGGSINKSGTGILLLGGSGSSTYTGATNVSQGVLVAAKASALGSTATGTSVSSGASLRLSGGITTLAEPLTINGAGINGAGGALSNAAGTNNFAGPVTLGSPAFIGAVAGTLLVSGDIDTTNNAHTLTADVAATLEFGGAGVLKGAGTLNKQGAGMLILEGTGVNTYTGTTQVFNGILRVAKNSALGSTAAETVTQGPGTLQVFSQSGVNIIVGTTIAEPIRINGSGFNSLGALQNGGGNNTWSGTVGVPNPASIGSSSGTLLISGTISGDQPLSKFGAGGVALSGNNTAFTGLISIQAGALNARSSNALGSTTGETQVSPGATLTLGNSGFDGINGVTIAGETLRLGGNGTLRASSAFGGGASSWGGRVIIDGTTSRTIDAQSPLTISGVISGTAPWTKIGSSTLTLSATNTSTGAVTVSAGTLLVNGTLPATVNVGGTKSPVLGGTGTVGAANIINGGTLDPGVNGPGLLTVTGNLAFSEVGSTLRVQLNGTRPGTLHDQVRVRGQTVRLGGRTFPTLSATLGFTSAVGDVFEIIDHTPDAGVTEGSFASTTLTLNGQTFRVVTNSGTGNDVVVRHENTQSAFANRSITSPIRKGQAAILRGTIVDPDPLDEFFLDVNWGDGSATQTFHFAPDAPRDVVLSHVYAKKGKYQVSLIWRDQNGGQKSDTLSVRVKNGPKGHKHGK